MRRYIGYATILIIIITFIIWGFNVFIQPILPPIINEKLVSFFVLMLMIIGAISNFKDAVEFVRFPFERHDEISRLSPSEEKRYRDIMLNKVDSYWIKGVLHKSVSNATFLNISKQYVPEKVDSPQRHIFQKQSRENFAIPSHKRISEIFDENSGELLILGEPGAGKTVLLLTLANELINKARNDINHPIPVIFMLSSWGVKQKSLREWLVDELKQTYYITRDISEYWLSSNSLLLLLDGLDDLKAESRDSCIQKINEFHKENGLVNMAISSRRGEYEQLSNHLCLQNAIVLLPLSSNEINRYLDGEGLDLLAVKQTLHHDVELQKLIESPLILTVMALAYRGKTIAELSSFNSIEGRRKHIFDNYLQLMFEWNKKKQLYPSNKVIKWLTWLAKILEKNSINIITVDTIQPNWFFSSAPQKRIVFYKILIGVILGLLFGIIGWLLHSLYYTICGVLSGISLGMKIDKLEPIVPTYGISISFRELIEGVAFGLLYGFIGGLIFSVPALLFYWILGSQLDKIMIWLSGGIYIPVNVSLNTILGFSIFSALLLGVFISPLIALKNRSADEKAIFSSGIWLSLKNGLLALIIFFLISTIIFGLMQKLVGNLLNDVSLGIFGEIRFGKVGGITFGMIFGILFGIIVGLYYGLYAFITHYIIRFFLFVEKLLPWNLYKFLDYATQLQFLRKVGRSYIFVHEILQQYFMNLKE